jgi:antitoxin MazE
MEHAVRKWGNSAAVRIPANVLGAARLSIDSPVTVRAERGRIVIEARRDEPYDIRNLIAQIDSSNLHGAVDTGEPRGNEVW